MKLGDDLNVELLDHTGGDLSVVNSARVSFNNWHNEMEEGDDKLIGFLLREHHGTPFEHSFFRFRVTAPIFVAREWMRHRTHSYNEMSGRYTELPGHFYIPPIEEVRTQVGKPGDYTFERVPIGIAEWFVKDLANRYEDAWKAYQMYLSMDIAKELARIVLPVGIFTQFIWSCNARALMHFLSLRSAPDAMTEIRNCAILAEFFLLRNMPITHQAFIDAARVAP